MTEPFFEQPILNSPYEEPSRHHALNSDGQPLDPPPNSGRRRSELITPVSKPRKRRRRIDADEPTLDLHGADGISTEEQQYNSTPIINDIRSAVADWRRLPSPNDWGFTPAVAAHDRRYCGR